MNGLLRSFLCVGAVSVLIPAEGFAQDRRLPARNTDASGVHDEEFACGAKPASSRSDLSVLRALKDPSERGTLSDKREFVRGDSGKWNDTASLHHVPPPERKPSRMSLDEWAERSAAKEPVTTAGEDNWLIFRTRQLDDNDRVWIEKIERRSNEFIVVMNEAIWQGHYFKTFTYYELTGVNLGPLPAGTYSVKWKVMPQKFKQLAKPAVPNRDNKDNWPLDAQRTDAKPTELQLTFTVR